MLDERTIPDAQLPTWMRQARRGIDWGVIIVMVLSAFIAWPLIINEYLPEHTALENYGFQVSDASSAMLQGWIYPRWSSMALQGYGMPMPHYLPSAAPNLTAMINVLFLNDIEQSIRFVMLAAFLLAGSTMYVLVTQRSGSRAGIVASTLYLFSPYVGLMTPYVRGDFAGVLSLAALPTLLWATNRLLLRNHRLDGLVIALSTAFLVLNDPLWLAIAILPLFAILIYDSSAKIQWRQIAVLLVSIFLGIMLAGMYWIPALLEQDAIRWLSPLIQAREEPLTLVELFARTEILDPNAQVYYPQWNLGWGLQIMLALGCLSMLFHRKETQFERMFLLLGIGVLIAAVWLFPMQHRLLGIAVFSFAIAGSASVQFVRHLKRWQELILGPLAMLSFIGISYPIWVQVPEGKSVQPLTQSAQIRYEYDGYGIAVLPPGQAIPVPLSDEALSNLEPVVIDEDGNINRFATVQSAEVQILPSSASRSGLPSQLLVATANLQTETHFSHYTVVTATAGDYLYERSFFPGWRARLDTEPLTLLPDEATGLMQVELPQTQGSDLFIYLGTNSVRQIGWVVSALSLISLIAYSALRWRRVRVRHETSILLRQSLARLLLFTAIFALILRIFPNLNPLRGTLAPPPEYSLEEYRQYPNLYAGNITLAQFCYKENLLEKIRNALNLSDGRDACQPATSYDPGDTVQLDLVWTPQEGSGDAQFMVQLRLRSGSTGYPLVEEGIRHPGNLPSNRWRQDGYVLDRYQFQLPQDVELGAYTVELEVLRCEPHEPGLYPVCEPLEPRLSIPEPVVVD